MIITLGSLPENSKRIQPPPNLREPSTTTVCPLRWQECISNKGRDIYRCLALRHTISVLLFPYLLCISDKSQYLLFEGFLDLTRCLFIPTTHRVNLPEIQINKTIESCYHPLSYSSYSQSELTLKSYYDIISWNHHHDQIRGHYDYANIQGVDRLKVYWQFWTLGHSSCVHVVWTCCHVRLRAHPKWSTLISYHKVAHQKRSCHSSLVTCSWFKSLRTTGCITGHLSENLVLPCPFSSAEVMIDQCWLTFSFTWYFRLIRYWLGLLPFNHGSFYAVFLRRKYVILSIHNT